MRLPTKRLLDFPVNRRCTSYRDVAAAKLPVGHSTFPPGWGEKSGGRAPRSPVVPPSPEGKGLAPGLAAATAAASAPMPGHVVSALGGLGRPSVGPKYRT